MADKADDILLFKLEQGIAEISLLHFLSVTNEVLLRLGVQVVEQVVVLDTRLSDTVTEVILYAQNKFNN